MNVDKFLVVFGVIFICLGVHMVFFEKFDNKLSQFSEKTLRPGAHKRLGRYQGVLLLLLGLFSLYLSFMR
jgi:hypothetical protein